MSVSIPDPQSAEVDSLEVSQHDEGKVVQLPLDEAARQRQEAHRVTEALRHQIALLSRHYAKDASRFQQALTRARTVARKAEQATCREKARSAAAEAELFALRGDIRFVQERLSRERRRAARLAEVARLPWWAFNQRRWALASIDADEAS